MAVSVSGAGYLSSMPLRAQLDGRDVIAPLLGDAAWSELRDAARRERRRVSMVCCGAPALPRVSKLGLRHFAHRPGAVCAASDGETVHHLHLKSELVHALAEHGWEAGTEIAGDGWRADVLCHSGNERVAFEVQWSGQSPGETLARSLRYAEAGVRVVWLMRRRIPHELQHLRDVPCFRVLNLGAGRYVARFDERDVNIPELVSAWFDGRICLTRTHPRRWALHASASHAAGDGRNAPAAGEITAALASALSARGESCVVRAPAGPPSSSRPDLSLLDLPGRRVAAVAMGEWAGEREMALWRARLGQHRKLFFLAGVCVGDYVRQDLEVVPVAGSGALYVADGGHVPLVRWASTLLGVGMRRARRLVLADEQKLTVYRLRLQCWKCQSWFTGVTTAGLWISRCDQEIEPIRLWEAGVVINRELNASRIPLPVNRVQWRRSRAMQTSGGSSSGWANVCPRCDAFTGQTFLDCHDGAPYLRDLAEVTFRLSAVALNPALRGQETPHWCDSGCCDERP